MKMFLVNVFLFKFVVTRAIHASSVSSTANTLRFFLLGLGKGGNSGSYWNMEENRVSSNEEELQGQTFNQAAIAKSMASYADSVDPPPSFVVTVGDNFYAKGVSSTTDSSWYYLWESVYLIYNSLKIPWYPTFGNHDYEGIPQAEIDRYHENPDGYWIFPAFNYTKRYSIPGGGTVQIIFIDTTTLAPSVAGTTNEKGGISTELQQARIINQLEHIHGMLNEALLNPPTWLLVAGHYPIYTAGEHGDTNELKKYIMDNDIFATYGVQAYLCGHDHISEHMYKDGIHYFVAGGGSMTSTLGNYKSDGEAIWTGPGYSAFAVMSATTNDLNIQYIDLNGNIKYNYTLTNPYSVYKPEIEPTKSRDPSRMANSKFNEWYHNVAVSYAFGGLLTVLVIGAIVGAIYSKTRKGDKATAAPPYHKASRLKNIPPYLVDTRHISDFDDENDYADQERSSDFSIDIISEDETVPPLHLPSQVELIQGSDSNQDYASTMIHQGAYSPSNLNRLKSPNRSSVMSISHLKKLSLFPMIASRLTSTAAQPSVNEDEGHRRNNTATW